MIDRKFLVDAQVWKLTEGEPVELKLDDRVYVFKPNTHPVIFKPKYKQSKRKPRNIKISDLQKWIQKGSFDVFTLDQFLKAFPKQKYNRGLNKRIVSLIDKKIITQLGKDKFQVNR